MTEHHAAASPKNRCVFLDRDGVLNKSIVRGGKPYPPNSAEELEVYPDVPLGCLRLKQAGFLLVTVTNQPDVGRGKQTRVAVEAINRKISDIIRVLDRFEVCFHGGADYGEPCDCRKPAAGMLYRAAAALEIDLASSFMIGDRWQDVDCAHAAGCRAIFIDHGYAEALRQKPDVTVKTFGEAVEAVLSDDRETGTLLHRAVAP
jgi:D-glycero-D-manno-heptose 1,7-bisphosphate phosphatase